jgi:hypothetical protein
MGLGGPWWVLVVDQKAASEKKGKEKNVSHRNNESQNQTGSNLVKVILCSASTDAPKELFQISSLITATKNASTLWCYLRYG